MNDLEPAIAILLTCTAVFFSAIFSGMEIAFVQSSKVRIGIDSARKGLVNSVIRRFNNNQDTFISSLLVGNNIVLVIYGIALSALINAPLSKICDNEAFVLIINTIISTTVILIAGEFIPKTTFRINPNAMLRLFAIPVYLVYIVLYPIAIFTSWLSRGMMRLVGVRVQNHSDGRITIDQLDDYISEALDTTNPTDPIDNEVKIFRNAIDFKDTLIGDCMIPRNEIIAVDIDTVSRDVLMSRFINTGLSKIVVYRHDIDDVLGYIHVSELFDTKADWKDKIKPVIFTPETMLANKMMRRLLAEKKSMAIVIDEFGGTAGLATLEDLVEEIFGEIEDEHDKKRVVARCVSPGVYDFSGRVEISQLRDDFDIPIPESEDYQTLAGYILHNLEAFPSVGDTFDIDNIRFTIRKSTSAKIQLVTLRLLN